MQAGAESERHFVELSEDDLEIAKTTATEKALSLKPKLIMTEKFSKLKVKRS